MTTNKEKCKKSPDGLHHYKYSQSQHAIFVTNGSHTCYSCVFCSDKYCQTRSYGIVPKNIDYPTMEELEKNR